MPLVIPNGYANFQLTIRNLDGGISGRSSVALGIHTTGTFGQTEVNRLSNLIRDDLKTLWDNRWEVGPTHVNFTVAGLPLVFDDTTAEAGTHAADTYAPPQVATVVTKFTSIAGRKFRGRMYLPGVPQGSVGDDGGINPAYVTIVNTAMSTLMADLVADAACDEISLFHDSTTPGATAPTAINSMFARSRAGTMRPRQRR